ncbi:MAG: EamA family transporter [Pseudomonadota bacterium]
MPRHLLILLTGTAPAIWGSTYLVTTEFLPDGYPLMAAMLRALPAGLILLMIARTIPTGKWIWRSIVLGALNFSVFWWLLFVAAYSLPGGVAATLGAVQPLIVLYLAKLMLDQDVHPSAVAAGIAGVLGVALLVLTPEAVLDPIGILAAFAGAVSMAAGTVLTRKWQPPVSALAFTSWQLTAGGLLLLPVALIFEPALPSLTTRHMAGFAYLGLIGGALTYILWFRGIAKLGPSAVAPLGLLSPVAAVLLGWVVLDQSLSQLQSIGIALVLASVWFSQHVQRRVLSTQTPPAASMPKHEPT